MNFSTKYFYLVLPMTVLATANVQAKDIGLTDNVYFITEQLIVPAGSNQSWKWSGFESMPTGGMYEQKASNQYSTNKSEYTLGRGIIAQKSIELMGTRTTPNVIKFTSGYGEGDDLWKLLQIVNPANVTKLKSNCNLKNVTIGGGESSGDSGKTLEYQNFYKWQRTGSKPLYIAESKGEGYVLTSVFNSYNWKNYTVVLDPKLFNKYDVWNTLKNGKEVTCTFS